MDEAPDVAAPQPELPSLDPTAWLNAVAELTRAVNRGDPLDDLLDLVAGAVAQLTGYDFCAVLVEDDAQESLLITGSYGLSREYVQQVNARRPVPVRPCDAGEGPSSRAFRSLRPSFVLDVSTHAPSRHWESVAAEQGYVSMLSVPLVVGQVPFGVLNCYTARRHAFSAEEVVRLESLANQAALAIETCRWRTAGRRDTEALAARVEDLQRQVAVLEAADEHLVDLLDRVLDGGGPQAVAHGLGQVLRCDVAIVGPVGRVLARTGGDAAAGRAAVVQAWLRDAGTRTDAAEDQVLDLPAEVLGPGPLHGLAAPFALDGDVIGHVHAVRRGAGFRPDERSFLARGASVAAAAMLKELTAQEVESRLSRAFLDELFAAQGAGSDALHAQARQLGADLSLPHTVLVVRLDHRKPPHEDLARQPEQRWLLPLVQRTLTTHGGTGLTAADGDSVVVLWREQPDGRSAAAFAQHLARELRAYGGTRSWSVSVGPTCSRVDEYGDANRLAVAALDLLRAAEQRDRVVDLRDLGAYRLLLQSRHPPQLLAFARDVLGALHDYDRQRSTQLVETLRSYMDHRCSAARTAEVLHVHVNTVAYRLHRVEELLAVNLRDARTLLDVELALMIEHVLGGPADRDGAAPTTASR